MKWNKLEKEATLAEIKAKSQEHPVIIFKHSTRCSISGMALNRLERSWKEEEMQHLSPYFLDLLSHRDISSKIAETFNVVHESPQLLLIDNGNCIYNASHMGISYEDLKKAANIR